MNTRFKRPLRTSAVLAMIALLSLCSEAAAQQLTAGASQERTHEGIVLTLVVTNISHQPVRVVIGPLQKTFPSRGGHLVVILQEPSQSAQIEEDCFASLLPGESSTIRLLIDKEQLPKGNSLIANVTYRISEVFGRQYGVWYGSISTNPAPK